MAVNIFDKYGIKQVANVYFEALDNDLSAGVYKGDIVLFLDTLKVSTIETTAENVEANGGWGNPRLISWDYGKEINVTLTDALMSLESLRFMMGGAIKSTTTPGNEVWVRRTAQFTLDDQGLIPYINDKFDKQINQTIKATIGHPIKLINLTRGTRTQIKAKIEEGNTDPNEPVLTKGLAIQFVNDSLAPANLELANNVESNTYLGQAGDLIRVFWEEKRASGEKKGAVEVTISPSTFPGTYRVVGDTFMRSQKTGRDEPFQFIIEKAKVQSSVTLTLEAEGDPSTFEMTLQVLRDESGEEMMKLVRYDTDDDQTSSSGNDQGSVGAASDFGG